MKIKFLFPAQRELDDAVAWYNDQFPGLGVDFLDELDKVIRRIALFPESGTGVEEGVRRCLLARFPYGIFFMAWVFVFRSRRLLIDGCAKIHSLM